MANKRICVTLDVLTQESTSFTNDPADANKIKSRIEQDNLKEVSRLQMVVEPSAVVETVPLPDASAQYVAIFCDQTINITLNGSDTPFNLEPKVAGTKAPVFYSKGQFTEIKLGNAGSVDANVDIILGKVV